MASKLPKPSGLKPPQFKLGRPLGAISENTLFLNRAHEAPPAVSRLLPSSRLKRRSKSVTDLSSIGKPLDFAALRLAEQARRVQSNKKSENKPIIASKNTPPKKGLNFGSNKPTATRKAGTVGAKRPLVETKSNDDSQPKPKVAKKIPDWDYKGRFNQLNERYTLAQELIKTMKLKIGEFDEIETNYGKVQKEAKDLRETKEKLKAKCEKLSSKLEELSSKNKEILEIDEKLKCELTFLEKKLEHIESDLKNSEKTNKKLLEENEIISKEVARLSSSLEELTDLYGKLSEKHIHLTQKHNELSESCRIYTEANKDLIEAVNEGKKEIQELKNIVAVQKSTLQELQAERRILHNTVQDLKGNIRVFCRVRPPTNAEEMNRLQYSMNFIDETRIEIKKSEASVSQITGRIHEVKSEFMFDKIFPPDSKQEEVFEDLSQLVQSALDGYDICVFAYGQTGSGKTYTMQGGERPEEKGMVPRTIDLIFQNIAELERHGWKYSVHASFLEIYNETVHDLLNINGPQKLEINFNDGKGTIVTNLTIQPIMTACELKDYMYMAHSNRATAPTNFNEHSSRSHAVTKIYLEGILKDQNIKYKGSINLVDLAGSESAKQSVVGERLTETKNINKSLATLGDVISALYSKTKHIPYRNSKLTYLLQSSLGGNSKTLMVVNISPFEECFGESISSLRFAAKVKEVKTGSKRNKTAIMQPMTKQKSTLT